VTTAWILDLGNGRLAAVGEGEQFHVVYDAQVIAVPFTPAHCRQALLWANQPIPVIDLGIWIDGVTSRVDSGYLGVYGYREGGDAAVRFGALWLSTPPRRATIAESFVISEPAVRTRLHQLSLAWFALQDSAVAVVDLTAMFAASTTLHVAQGHDVVRRETAAIEGRAERARAGWAVHD
jgi:hypothetical protein